MEKLSTPLQIWYNHYTELIELNRSTEKINNLITKVKAKQSYTEAELDEIVENRKTVNAHNQAIESKKKFMADQGKKIVELLSDLGVPAGASVSCSVKAKHDNNIPMKVWYHDDNTFGQSFGA